MPVSAKQLNFCDVSTDFDKFYNQNQDDLLSLLNQLANWFVEGACSSSFKLPRIISFSIISAICIYWFIRTQI